MMKNIHIIILLIAFSFSGLHGENEVFLDNWQSYISRINSMIQDFPGKVGVVVKDLRQGSVYAYNADEQFVSASLIKLPILTAVFKEFVDGRISLIQTLKISDACRIGGSGILKNERSGAEYSVYELSYIMIKHSDNTAAKMLTELIGYDRMNQTFKMLGLQGTNISPKSFELTNGEISGDSYTTPRDIAQLLNCIYEEKMFRRYISKQMIDILKLPIDRYRLNKELPKNFSLAHKTGLLRGACHDAGIVFSPNGDYMICILTDNNKDYQLAKHFIANLGKLTFQQLEKI